MKRIGFGSLLLLVFALVVQAQETSRVVSFN